MTTKEKWMYRVAGIVFILVALIAAGVWNANNADAAERKNVNNRTMQRVEQGWTKERVENLFNNHGRRTTNNHLVIVGEWNTGKNGQITDSELIMFGTGFQKMYKGRCGSVHILYVQWRGAYRVGTVDGYFNNNYCDAL